MKTPTLEVVSKEAERDAKMQNLKELKSQLEKKIADKTAELEKKVYILEGKAETAERVKGFLTTEAEWKFTESMGVIEAVKEVDKAIESIKKGKSSEFTLNPLAIEATYYLLTKKEGKGLTEAYQYYEFLLKPVSDALSRSKADRQVLDQMQRDFATLENALENGANVEDSLVKEITAELENDTYGK